MIIHDRTHFYKYVSASTLKKILTSKTLRWSSPLRFNDPFDNQFDLQFDFGPTEMTKPFINRLFRLYSGKLPLPLNSEKRFPKLIPLIRGLIPGISEEKFYSIFSEAIDDEMEKSFKPPDEFNRKWKAGAETTYILCLTETHDNLLMWSHYSKDHTGAVIKLKYLPEPNIALGDAKKVRYQEEMPKIGSPDDWLASSFGEKEIPIEEIVETLSLTKAIDWSYEKEWRVILSGNKPNDLRYEDISIRTEEIEEVLLGCRMTQEDEKEITAIIREEFPSTTILKAEKNSKNFALDFHKI